MPDKRPQTRKEKKKKTKTKPHRVSILNQNVFILFYCIFLKASPWNSSVFYSSDAKPQTADLRIDFSSLREQKKKKKEKPLNLFQHWEF